MRSHACDHVCISVSARIELVKVKRMSILSFCMIWFSDSLGLSRTNDGAVISLAVFVLLLLLFEMRLFRLFAIAIDSNDSGWNWKRASFAIRFSPNALNVYANPGQLESVNLWCSRLIYIFSRLDALSHALPLSLSPHIPFNDLSSSGMELWPMANV